MTKYGEGLGSSCSGKGLRSPTKGRARGFSRTTMAALTDPDRQPIEDTMKKSELGNTSSQDQTNLPYANQLEGDNRMGDPTPPKTREKYLSDLASSLQGHARCLSYNDENGPLKHRLHEASHALDSVAIRVHKKKDGLLLITGRGKSRFATARERLAIWLLRGNTGIEV